MEVVDMMATPPATKEDPMSWVEALMGRGDLEMRIPQPPVIVSTDKANTQKWTFDRFKSNVAIWVYLLTFKLGGVIDAATGMTTFIDRFIGEIVAPGKEVPTDVHIRGSGIPYASPTLYRRYLKGLGANSGLLWVSDALPVTGVELTSFIALPGRFSPGPWSWKIPTFDVTKAFGAAATLTSMSANLFPVFGNPFQFGQAPQRGPKASWSDETRIMSEKMPADTKFTVPWNPQIKVPFNGVNHMAVENTWVDYATLSAQLSGIDVGGSLLDANALKWYRQFSRSIIRADHNWNNFSGSELEMAFSKPQKVQFTNNVAISPTITAILDS
jgi:hypothetical protein